MPVSHKTIETLRMKSIFYPNDLPQLKNLTLLDVFKDLKIDWDRYPYLNKL